MRWEDERWVKLYTRDDPEWLILSWQARGLFYELLRKVDRAGILPLGRIGAKGVAVLVRGSWAEVQGPLDELLADGCLAISGDKLLIPGFTSAQEARGSRNGKLSRRRHWSRRAYRIVHARDGGRCRYCGRIDGPMSVDHVTPRIQGGGDAADNLVTACKSCNSRKGGRTPQQARMQILPENGGN